MEEAILITETHPRYRHPPAHDEKPHRNLPILILLATRPIHHQNITLRIARIKLNPGGDSSGSLSDSRDSCGARAISQFAARHSYTNGYPNPIRPLYSRREKTQNPSTVGLSHEYFLIPCCIAEAGHGHLSRPMRALFVHERDPVRRNLKIEGLWCVYELPPYSTIQKG